MSQREWNKKPHLSRDRRAAFPIEDGEPRPQMAGGKRSWPLWAVILLHVIEAIAVVAAVVVLLIFVGPIVAYVGAFAGALILFAYSVRASAYRLTAIRREVISKIRADEIPDVPVSRVLLNYMVMFLPTYIMAFGGGMMPYRGAGGFFFIPALVITILFGIWHSALWGDLGWRRLYYVLFLAGGLCIPGILGLLIRFLF